MKTQTWILTVAAIAVMVVLCAIPSASEDADAISNRGTASSPLTTLNCTAYELYTMEDTLIDERYHLYLAYGCSVSITDATVGGVKYSVSASTIGNGMVSTEGWYGGTIRSTGDTNFTIYYGGSYKTLFVHIVGERTDTPVVIDRNITVKFGEFPSYTWQEAFGEDYTSLYRQAYYNDGGFYVGAVKDLAGTPAHPDMGYTNASDNGFGFVRQSYTDDDDFPPAGTYYLRIYFLNSDGSLILEKFSKFTLVDMNGRQEYNLTFKITDGQNYGSITETSLTVPSNAEYWIDSYDNGSGYNVMFSWYDFDFQYQSIRVYSKANQETDDYRYTSEGWAADTGLIRGKVFSDMVFTTHFTAYKLFGTTYAYLVYNDNIPGSDNSYGTNRGCDPGESVTFYVREHYDDPVYEGHHLLGWSTDPNDVRAQYQKGDKIVVQAGDEVTLYAIWDGTYTVTFEGSEGGSVPEPIDVPRGTSYELVDNEIVFTYAGKTYTSLAIVPNNGFVPIMDNGTVNSDTVISITFRDTSQYARLTLGTTDNPVKSLTMTADNYSAYGHVYIQQGSSVNIAAKNDFVITSVTGSSGLTVENGSLKGTVQAGDYTVSVSIENTLKFLPDYIIHGVAKTTTKYSVAIDLGFWDEFKYRTYTDSPAGSWSTRTANAEIEVNGGDKLEIVWYADNKKSSCSFISSSLYGDSLGTSVTVDDDTTYYPAKRLNYFTLAFYANGGSGAPQAIEVKSLSDSYTFTIPNTIPTRSGYVFNGWSTDASLKSGDIKPKSTYTLDVSKSGSPIGSLYAIWSDPATAVLTLDPAGGTCQQTVFEGAQEITLPEASKTGMVFTGWYDDEILVGKAGDSYTISTTKTLTAHYSTFSAEIAVTEKGEGQYTFSLSYKFNNEPVTLKTASISWYLENTLVGFHDNKLDYKFDNSGTYTIKATVVNTDYGQATATKTVKVKIDGGGGYIGDDECTVSFNSNGGSAVKTLVIEKGKTATKPTDPTKDGFSFAGWYTDSTLETEFDWKTKIDADITLYASWEEAKSGDLIDDIVAFVQENPVPFIVIGFAAILVAFLYARAW